MNKSISELGPVEATQVAIRQLLRLYSVAESLETGSRLLGEAVKLVEDKEVVRRLSFLVNAIRREEESVRKIAGAVFAALVTSGVIVRADDGFIPGPVIAGSAKPADVKVGSTTAPATAAVAVEAGSVAPEAL